VVWDTLYILYIIYNEATQKESDEGKISFFSIFKENLEEQEKPLA